MDPDSSITTALVLVALLAANAFFVTTEFSLLTLRRSRLEHSAREGDARAARILRALDRVEELALVAQLGRSATSLAIGYLSARLALAAAGPLGLVPGAAVAIGIALAVWVHALVGEQIPKLVGVQRAGWVALRLVAGPLTLIGLPLRPFTWIIHRLMGGVARAGRLSFSGMHGIAHTPEEIQLLVARGQEEGVVEDDEREMIEGVFEFSDTVAREVMTPRIDVIGVPDDVDLPTLLRIIVEEGHSRVPVYSETIDTVVGVLLAKDLFPLLLDGAPDARESFDVTRLMRRPYFVPEGKLIDEILAEFRQQSVHLAVVVDEFGGTSGILTMEDLLEEIVGDINDEHDIPEPEFADTPEGDVLIDGGSSLSDVNERFGLALPDDDYDTVGGYVFGSLGRVPELGDEVVATRMTHDYSDASDESALALVLRVEEVEDRRVVRLRLTKVQPVAVPEPEGTLAD